MTTVNGYAAHGASSPLGPFAFERRDPGPRDVEIDIQFCGVCHSDLHTVRNEWANSVYPVVPGHEILGRVSRVGVGVKGFKAGDITAVGCMVDSCRTCPKCAAGLTGGARARHVGKGERLTPTSPVAASAWRRPRPTRPPPARLPAPPTAAHPSA